MSKEIHAFFEAWSIGDAEKRNAQIDGSIADTIFYADLRTPEPITDGAALKDYVAMFSQMAPGMPVSVGKISTTLEFVRATILFGPVGQAQTGQYTIETDPNGKLTRMIGFVGLGEPE